MIIGLALRCLLRNCAQWRYLFGMDDLGGNLAYDLDAYDPDRDGPLMFAAEVANLLRVNPDGSLRKWRSKWPVKGFGPRWVRLGDSRHSAVRYPKRWVTAWMCDELGYRPEIDGALMTVPETAEALGVSAGTLQKWRDRGTGPECIRIGSARNSDVRYPRQWVVRWLDDKRLRFTATGGTAA